jgi:membrane-associated phospholipid phosphatase
LERKAPLPEIPPARVSVNWIQRWILLAQIGAAVILIAVQWSQGIFPSLGWFGLIAVSVFLWRAGDRFALLNFFPWLMLLAAYELLRGIAITFNPAQSHITDVIAWERALCGGVIPSHVVQQALGTQPYAWLLDIVANGFYMTHFIAAVALAWCLWRLRRAWYWPFLFGMTVLSFAAFFTYLVFPAAPPWWASANGFLPDQPVNLAHSLLSPDYIMATAIPIAAMPSLHAAYPFYLAFFGIRAWGRKGAWMLILPVGVALSSIYLGHHYVVDILAGVGYAVVIFALTLWLTALVKRRPNHGAERG